MCVPSELPVAGARGPFALVQGKLAPDVLEWLREEVAQGTLEVSFEREAAARRLENGVKMEWAGHLEGDGRQQGSINGLDCSQPFPLTRVRSFSQAFKDLTKSALSNLTRQLHRKLRSLSEQD